MPMDIARFRKLVEIDPDDPLSRFGLGQQLWQEDGSREALLEAAEHLRFANQRDPRHLATDHILGQVLIDLGETEEARTVLKAGCAQTEGLVEGMGRDLGPAMRGLLQQLDNA